MAKHKYVDEFIELYETGKIKLNKERIQLIELIKKDIYKMDDVYFDEKLIDNFIAFTEKYYFPLQPFQKFITCFIFMYYDNGDLVFDEHFHYEARGAGKNGFLSALSNFLISPLHPINDYNVSIVANSEKQAKTSFVEVYNKIDREDKLKEFFAHRKVLIECYQTKSIFQFHTSNAGTKDGLRDGTVIFDEVHSYENSEIVDVFTSGLGKVKNPRIFYVGTDGYIRDGYIDKLKERARNILDGSVSVREDGLFPFMCCIDNEDEMNDNTNWQKANPMFHEPMSDYARNLFKTVNKQYTKLQNDPSGYEEFVTKRMNLPRIDLEKNVTSWEKIESTNQPYDLDELKQYECIGCLDYASIRDFVSCGLLFYKDDKYILPRELTQQYACKPFVDKHYAYSQEKNVGSNKKDHRKFAPIREWENEGLMTVLDKEAMDPYIVVDFFVQKRNEGWNIIKIIGDNFKMDILRKPLEDAGFIVEVIRNPDSASALLSPRIELAFDEGRIVFGDNPMMRWNTNNVLVIIDNRGNKLYRKKEATKRKTDGFMMFLYGVWACRDINTNDMNSRLDMLDSFSF